MNVMDASVLIAHLDSDDAHHDAAETLLVHAIDDDLGANPLTLAEVLVVPVRMATGTGSGGTSRPRGERIAVPSRHRCKACTVAGGHWAEDARLLRPARG